MKLEGVELWGGVECTVNRVRNKYFDQLYFSGHQNRLSDLDLFAELGIRTLRFPLLWEKHIPKRGEEINWRWADKWLNRLDKLSIEPIVGLVHHGSGPHYTSLLDPTFPHHLARFGEAVAQRYPHLKFFTPVNEPLTTARFSCLYGFWYPHTKEIKSFLGALLHECRAVSLTMEAIRTVIPEAKLVQTEDLGGIASTEFLRYQAEFENERRWLTFDILTGKLTPSHPLWGYFLWAGVDEDILYAFQEEYCPPDIIGLNHYVTSNRFLDHRIELYPEQMIGGNHKHRYVDVEWIRVGNSPAFLLPELLQETWERYHIPIVMTEAHLGCCDPDEQAAWIGEFLKAAVNARKAHIDVRGVTLWSLLGAYEWNSLVTEQQGHYEAGLFEIRDNKVYPTPNVERIKKLLSGKQITDLVHLNYQGWWRRKDRIVYPAENDFSSEYFYCPELTHQNEWW